MAPLQPKTATHDLAYRWFSRQGWHPFLFQEQAWQEFGMGKHGLVNAPTGSGKTYSLFIPIALNYLEAGCPPGLFAIWVTPIRALTKEIYNACSRAADGLGIEMEIAVRTGDTDQKERARQKQKPPTLLITTPESIHLLLATKGYDRLFRHLHAVVVDEWHELLGNKRGVLVELGLSRLKTIASELRIWGISATVGNLDQALEVLLGADYAPEQAVLIRANIHKEIQVISILDDEVEKLPWGGHLGIKLLERVIPIIMASESALIFTNTRAQCEIWYQRLLEAEPQLAGWMAMHHSA
ncbi:MAG: DEAD/DEAH box helicase, partial [Saprospiraceae bacterium]